MDENENAVVCAKIMSDYQMPDWVIDSFKDNAFSKVKIAFSTILSKMKVM